LLTRSALKLPEDKEHNAVERFFANIKHFRRVVTRYEKLAQTYMGMVLLSAVLVWLGV